MPDNYYSLVRHDAIALMDRNRAQRVLEIGCGTGQTLRALKSSCLASEVTGVELEPSCHAPARANTDRFFSGDIESLTMAELGDYHAVLLLDVLEHLVHPFTTLRSVSTVLLPDGYLVLSFPNIRNFAVLKKLIVDGLWEYQESGILDKGHLRFFTRKSFLKAMSTACPDLVLEALQTKPNRQTRLVRLLSRLPLLGDFFVCQFILKYRLAPR
jgi:O-antigen biosynthesis protein